MRWSYKHLFVSKSSLPILDGLITPFIIPLSFLDTRFIKVNSKTLAVLALLILLAFSITNALFAYYQARIFFT